MRGNAKAVGLHPPGLRPSKERGKEREEGKTRGKQKKQVEERGKTAEVDA